MLTELAQSVLAAGTPAPCPFLARKLHRSRLVRFAYGTARDRNLDERVGWS